MIVTIDGPAGAGKSYAARTLAQRLNFHFLDTGAMYRVVTWAAMQKNLKWNEKAKITHLAQSTHIELLPNKVLMNGQDVTRAIRTLEVTTNVKYVADNHAVRDHLVSLQRQFASGKNCITEGRDQASIVFPDSRCKIFLTASPKERARRRHRDLIARGESIDLETVLKKQQQRDQQDQNRAYGGLTQTPDSIEVCTDGLSPEQVVDRLERIVQRTMPNQECEDGKLA